MNEIIPVNNETMTVSARDLHDSLEISKRFSAWFETNSQGFTEGEDFRGVYLKVRGNQYGGEQEIQDYEITLDMAKHICLMSRTEKGKQVRQYLIDLEKAWNTPEQIMARALKMADATISHLKEAVLEMRPKAEYFDALVDKKLNTTIRDTAKELGVKETEFVTFLLSRKYVYREQSFKGKGKLKPYAQYAEGGKGLFVLKDQHNSNNGWTGIQMYITPKGKETFRLLLENEN